MWNPKQTSTINKSLDHLSSKFNELEKMCQSSVQKGLAESKNILSQQTTLSSEIYSNLIKEQTRLENNQRALISIRKSYNDELNNLRLIVFGESIESTSAPDKSFAELKSLIEETVLDTRDKVIEMPELNYFDNTIKERVQNYFEESFQRLDSAFLQFNNVKELNAGQINFKKIEMIANTNLLTLTGIDNVISQAKRRILRSLEAASTCSSSFGKEVQSSEGLLNQIRDKVLDIKQGINEGISSSRLQKSCESVEKLVVQASNSNSKKTELFESANKELENICSKFNSTVKELTKHSEVIRNNHQTLESTINKEKKKVRIAAQVSEQNEQIGKEDEQRKYHSASNWYTRQVSSPSLGRSPLLSEIPDFMETLSQKILHLRTTTGNFIGSCEKMAALVINTSSEGNYAVKVFENEKKLVENYIISLAEFVMQNKNRSQESALTKASSPQHFRSTGGFDLSPDHNRDSLFRSVDTVKSASKLDKLKALESPNQMNKVQFLSRGFEDEYAGRGRSSQGFRDKNRLAGASADPYESHDSHRYDSRAISSKVSPLRSPGHKLEKESDDTARRTEKEKNRALLSNLLQKVKDLSEQNEKLKKEIPRISKEKKKLELKADKRKKTVKQLFELVTEKEKEVNYYKTNYNTLLTKAKNISGVDVEQIEQIVDKRGEAMMEKYKELEAKMGAKETEIQKLKEIVSAGATPGSKAYGGKKSPRFAEEEEDEGSRPSREQASSKINLDDLVAQTKELDKKRENIEEALQNINNTTSPSQVKELNGLLTSLKKEKEQNLIKIRDLKSTTTDDKSIIERLETENKALEARCLELLNDIEQVQTHKQKIEKSYQEETRLLNDKVKELNEYIRGLEAKKNEKLREALSPDKWKANLDFKDVVSAVSPQKSDEGQSNENKKLKSEIKGLVSKVECLLDHFGITKEEYSMMEPDEKINIISARVKKEEEEVAKKEETKKLSKLADLEKNNQLLRDEVASQQEKVAKVNSERQKAEERVESLNSQLRAKEEEIARLAHNKGNEDALKGSVSQYENEIRTLKDQLSNKENSIKDLERKIGENNGSIANLQKKYNEKEEELQNLKQEFNTEKAGLQQEIEAASSRTLEQANSKATQDIEKYKTEINELNSKLSSLENQIASLNKEKQEVQNSLEAVAREKETLQGQINDLKGQNATLDQAKRTLEIQVSTLEVKVAAGANDQQDVIDKLSKLQGTIDSLRSEKTKAEEELSNATAQFELENKTLKQELEKIINEKEVELKDRKDDLQKAEKAHSELISTNNELNRRISELTKANEELRMEKEASLNEKILLSEQSSQAREAIKNQISEYEKTIQKEKDQLNQAQNELVQLKSQKENVQKELEAAGEKVQELERKLEEKENELQKVNEENNNVKNELKKKEDEVVSQQQEFNKKREELEQTLTKGNNDVTAKQEEIEKLKENISNIQEQLDEEKKKVQEMVSSHEKKLLEAHREFYEKNKQISNQNETLVRDNQLLKLDNAKFNREYQAILDKEAELQSGLNQLIEKHEEVTKNLEAEKQLTKTLQDETRAESQRLHRKVEKLQRELEKSKESGETLKTNYDKLVEEHKQKQEHIHALGQEIDQLNGSLKAKVSELEVSKNSGSKEAQSIRKEYDQQLQNLNIENESLKRTKEELEEEIKTLKDDLRVERENIEQLNSKKDALEEKGDQLSDEIASLKDKLADVEGELEKLRTESNARIEKLVQEEKALKEENKRLENENEELKMTTLTMREEIVNLGSKSSSENEKRIVELQEKFTKEKEELAKLVKTLKSDSSEKIKRVSEDIKEVVEILPTEYVPDDEEGMEEQVKSSIWMNAIKEYIIETNGMRREYKDLQQEVQETQTEARNLQEKLEHDEKLRKELERRKEALESENKNLKAEVQSPQKPTGSDQFLKPQSPHREPFSFRKKSDARDPSFSVPDEIDDVKVRSFLEESIKENRSGDRRDERLFSQEQEQIKTLYEQIRQLQDENDKLETENRQLKTKYEMLGFEHEDLKGELADKDSEIKKFEEQLFFVKEEFSKLQMEKDRKGDNPIAHEKQHIRTMFTKFMLSALQDAEDLLKLLLSLLDISEKDKTQLTNEFKSKNTKKGVFAKLF